MKVHRTCLDAGQNLLNQELAPVLKHFSWSGNLLSLENLENKILT